jgi:16S rRNA G966 N2-methylase RsmD
MPKVMLAGPFSCFMTKLPSGGYRFDEGQKARILQNIAWLTEAGHEVLSAHATDKFGEHPWDQDFVQRDLSWAEACDCQVVMLPTDGEHRYYRSDGTMLEMGYALAKGKPVIVLAEPIASDNPSFFLASVMAGGACRLLSWNGEHRDALLRAVSDALGGVGGEPAKPREHRSDVERVLDDLRHETAPHDVVVAGVPLTVLPGVLSPRYSHAPDTLISKWKIPDGSTVLDLGCGSGVLGIAALKAGASRLVSLDINSQAVATTTLNLEKLGLVGRGEARHSDAYSALRKDERFDRIVFAAPYWKRRPQDDLERSCFDDDYEFFGRAIAGAARHLNPGGLMYVVFADQGDVQHAMRIIDGSSMKVSNMHLVRAAAPATHTRIVWELRPIGLSTVGGKAEDGEQKRAKRRDETYMDAQLVRLLSQ